MARNKHKESGLSPNGGKYLHSGKSSMEIAITSITLSEVEVFMSSESLPIVVNNKNVIGALSMEQVDFRQAVTGFW